MHLYLGFDEKVWASNDKPIRGSGGRLDIIGKTKDDYDAQGCTVHIHFAEDDCLYRRQEYLLMLKDEVDGLLKENTETMVKQEEERKRQEVYQNEVEELKKAQQVELEQLDAVRELRQRHQKETEAVKEQLRKKYGIVVQKESEDDE